MIRPLALAGALFGGSGVMLGAFGAHALRNQLSPRLMEVWETAVQYQLLHAVMLLGVALLIDRQISRSPLLSISGWLFIAGVLCFSGSLYALCLTDLAVLGPVTPVGGVLLIAGWLCVAAHFLANRDPLG